MLIYMDVYLSSSFSLYLITSLVIKSGISTANQGPNYNRTNINFYQFNGFCNEFAIIRFYHW